MALRRDRYGYGGLAVTSLQTRLKTMRRETITATGAGIINPTTITTKGDLLNLQETPPATSVTMSAPADLSSQSVPSPAVSTSAWSASSPSLPEGKPAVKLPKLSLPTFSGEYLKFNAFWQAFEISVISQNIPNSSKFAYLNSLLSGDAAHAVSGIAMTDAGFTDTCSILKERLGDSNQLIFKHLQELLKLNPPKVLNSCDTECLWDFYNSVQSHVRSLSFLGIAKYDKIITPIIISRLPCQLALEWADVSKGKGGDLPHLLTFLQDSVATRQRALCFSTSSAKATSKSSSESTLPERLPTASALTVSEQVYSHSDTTRDSCFTCGKDHSLVSCDQFLKSSVTKRRKAIYNYGARYKCFKANHLAKNCTTKIKCHHCDAPHHHLLCKLGDGVHGSDETNT